MVYTGENMGFIEKKVADGDFLLMESLNKNGLEK